MGSFIAEGHENLVDREVPVISPNGEATAGGGAKLPADDDEVSVYFGRGSVYTGR